MSRGKISRRQFLYASAMTTSGLVLAACGGAATEGLADAAPVATPTPLTEAAMAEVAEQGATQAIGQYKEAPSLAALVAEGKLPPVDERLPEEPIVVDVVNEIGRYGGTMYIGTPDLPQGYFHRYWNYQPLWRWAPRWQGTMPGIAKSVDVNDENTEFTFHLRPGIKWSDGEPFTTADYMFWYENIVLNEEYSPTPPGWLLRNDEVAKFEALDEHTLRVTFAAPNGIFLMNLAEGGNSEMMTTPKHYLSKFHPNFNENYAAEAEAAGFATWAEWYDYHKEQANDSDLPVLGHFHMELDLEDDNTQVAASRNPYYHKVDVEGNQLPYIDRCVSFMIQDVELLTLKTLNGEIDHVADKYNTPANKPVYIDNMEQGNYRFFNVVPTFPNSFNIACNLNHPDPVKREIFQNKDFRIGLSHAINRLEIISIVFPGVTEPHQTAPRPESRFYHEQLAKQYTEFSLDLANEHLDKTGWTERDAEGYRIGPDGNRLSFVVMLDEDRTSFVDTMVLVEQYWKEVGIEAILETMVRRLWEERVRGNGMDWEISGHSFGGGIGEYVLLDPRWYVPINNGNSLFAKGWANWYNKSDSGIAEEPPAIVQEQMELYDQAVATADSDEQQALMMQVLDIAADQFYCMGICYEPLGYGIASNRMKNVPDDIPLSWTYPTPGPDNMDQMWIDDESTAV